ncbi:MAG: hypothetical protein DRP78_06035 [Candidatus Omnitrophota bacterium]|nr:MAG: hypothetical protein DRP78_06035 [Candidatus Omnitrophota bacterium]
MSGEKFVATAGNNRLVKFTFDGQQRKLISPIDEFLNNFSFFPAETNMTGYIFFKFSGNLERKINLTTFIFESFDNKIKKLCFKQKDIQEECLLFDDSIWK